VAIAIAGGIQPLVALVQSGTDDGKENAARALGSLALDNADNQVAIANAWGIEPLVALLLVRSGTNDRGKTMAAKALGSLAHDNPDIQVRKASSTRPCV